MSEEITISFAHVHCEVCGAIGRWKYAHEDEMFPSSAPVSFTWIKEKPTDFDWEFQDEKLLCPDCNEKLYWLGLLLGKTKGRKKEVENV